MITQDHHQDIGMISLYASVDKMVKLFKYTSVLEKKRTEYFFLPFEMFIRRSKELLKIIL